ncbi:uncharacterized protein EV422DRAFT_544874, partial [Fimicolochytrium jonesii]|uniref:uncharacterized protein n=1 Tax=Fimicolochytrium jonesii TaxID=1396493 RepID=UPI0022FEBE5F
MNECGDSLCFLTPDPHKELEDFLPPPPSAASQPLRKTTPKMSTTHQPPPTEEEVPKTASPPLSPSSPTDKHATSTPTADTANTSLTADEKLPEKQNTASLLMPPSPRSVVPPTHYVPPAVEGDTLSVGESAATTIQPRPYPTRKIRRPSQTNSICSEVSRLSYITLPGSVIGDDGFAPGVLFEYFKGEFTGLPDFNTLQAHSAGVMKSIAVDGETEREVFDHGLKRARPTEVGNFAVRYTAQVKIPHAGPWTFYLASNDGAALYISGKKVIENDGSHYVTEKEGSIKIPAPGYYTFSVWYFHKNGKMMEGVRTGAYLTLSYYFAGSGWLPFPTDRVSKQVIPDSAYVHNPADERVVRILDASRALTWDLPDATEDAETTIANLEKDLRDISDRLITLQTALEHSRRHTATLVRALATQRLFRPTEQILADLDTRQGEDEWELLHARQKEFVEQHVGDVARLKTGYFFALGVHYKLQKGCFGFSIQV